MKTTLQIVLAGMLMGAVVAKDGLFELGARTPSSMVFLFKCKSLKEGKLWLKFIQKHFKIDPSKVKIKAPGSPESAGEDPAAAAPSNAKARRVV